MTTEVITFYVVYIDHDITYSNYHARNIIFFFKKGDFIQFRSIYWIFLKKEKSFTCDDFLQTMNVLTFVSRKGHAKIPNKVLIFEYYVLFLNLINLHSYICIFCLVSFFLEIISSRFQISTIKSSLQDVSLIFFFCTTRLILIWQEIGYVYMSSCD